MWLGLFAAIITELTRRIEGGSANVLAQAPGSEEEEKWRRFVYSVCCYTLHVNLGFKTLSLL